MKYHKGFLLQRIRDNETYLKKLKRVLERAPTLRQKQALGIAIAITKKELYQLRLEKGEYDEDNDNGNGDSHTGIR